VIVRTQAAGRCKVKHVRMDRRKHALPFAVVVLLVGCTHAPPPLQAGGKQILHRPPDYPSTPTRATPVTTQR
jgi:hypothetical protein